MGIWILGFYQQKFVSNKLRCFLSLEAKGNDIEHQKKILDENKLACGMLECFKEIFTKAWNMTEKDYDQNFYQSEDWYSLKAVIIKMIRNSFMNGFKVCTILY